MPVLLSLEELEAHVGCETGVGPWFEIDQGRINQFADVTVDHQFIHVDVEKAKETPFGTTIAHGFHSRSLLSHIAIEAMVSVKGVKMGLNYGFEKVRFLNPVKVGSRIRARGVLGKVDIKDGGERALVSHIITVEIEGEDTPAYVAEWLTMLML